MTRRRILSGILAAAALAGAALGVAAALRVTPPLSNECAPADLPATLSPDYSGVTIPPNIAPLNFTVRESGTAWAAVWSDESGRKVESAGRSQGLAFPIGPWRALLAANRGKSLSLDVFARDESARWKRFPRATIQVAEEEIDPWLVYREMPVYNLAWTDMGCYQRDLTCFDVEPILRNKSYGFGCMNCHTFLAGNTDRMVMNVRVTTGESAGGMLIAEKGRVTRIVDTKGALGGVPAVYLAWHPSGRTIAFSVNKILQCFHTFGNHRDTFDSSSDIGIYRLDTNTITTSPVVCRPDRTETYPAWSPDGKYLYYCSAPQLDIRLYTQVRYDLMRVSYDLGSDAWGEPETVLRGNAFDEHGLSISHPRFSPDGRFILMCMTEFGNFPAFSPSSDLWMYDASTKECRRLDINSPESDAYHSWSSNGRWIVFSSKRRDGVFAMPYFSHVDASGHAAKPFLLPQEDPGFYESNIRMNNLPELVKERVPLTARQVAAAIHDPSRAMKAVLDPRVKQAPGGGLTTSPSGPYVE